MSLSSDLAIGHRTLRDYAPNHCVFRFATVDCTASTESRGTILAIGGMELEIQLTLYILKEDLMAAFRSQIAEGSNPVTPPVSGDNFLITADSENLTADDLSSIPHAGERITYHQRDYRIAAVRTESSENIYRLELGSIDR